jgi:hypothetical protein
MLRSVDWHLVTDVSRQYIGPTSKVDIGQYGINKLSRNVGDYQATLRNTQEERRCHLHRGGSVKSRKR